MITAAFIKFDESIHVTILKKKNHTHMSHWIIINKQIISTTCVINYNSLRWMILLYLLADELSWCLKISQNYAYWLCNIIFSV